MKAGFALLAGIAVVLVWWFGFRSDTAAPPPPASDPHNHTPAGARAEVAQAPAAGRAPGNAPDAPAAVREQVETDFVPPVARPDEAVLFGRCVDEAGAPLAGVTVRLHGWSANSARSAAYSREHGEVVWQDPQDQQTRADGRFVVRFVPPPPYQFTLDLGHEAAVSFGGRWSRIDAGTVKDLGDIVMVRGAQVGGRVVDTDGRPVADVEVVLDRYNRADRWKHEIHPEERYSARTGPDGSFRMGEAMAVATWNLRVGGAQLTENRREVEIAAPATQLELVTVRAADVPSIHGVVVDETGAAVGHARITQVGNYRVGTRGGPDGSFVLQQPQASDVDGPFALHVDPSGHEELTTEAVYEWGMRDVRLTVRSGIDVQLCVRRADDGQPVDEFGLFLTREASNGVRPFPDWQHEGGDVALRSLRRGMHTIHVVPRSTTGLAMSGPVELEVRDGGPTQFEVRLETLVEQQVRVSYVDGSAAAGCEVELLLAPADGEVDGETRASGLDDYGYLQPRSATKVDTQQTDAEGVCRVRGSPRLTHVLRVHSGETAFVRQGVQLGGAAIEIVVTQGATLRVTLRPIELLGDLRVQAFLPRAGGVEPSHRRKLPGIAVRRRIDGRFEVVPREDPRSVPFDEHGRAVLAGVPAGKWDLILASSFAYDEGGWTTETEPMRVGLVLKDGDDIELTLDLPQKRLGTLAATMVVDGKPFAGGIQLSGDCGVLPDGQPAMSFRNALCDDDGNFEILLPPGSWRVGAFMIDASFTAWADGDVGVRSGERSRADFSVQTARVALRILAPDGNPAVGVRPMLFRGGMGVETYCEATDDEGRTMLATIPGTMTAKVWIRSLADPVRLQAFLGENHMHQGALERAQVTTAPFVVAAGAEQPEIEVRLPADWDR